MTNNITNVANRKAIVIAGITGDIGSEFAKVLTSHGEVYGLSRHLNTSGLEHKHISADLLKREEVDSAFQNVGPADELIYLHLVGKFRFEDANHPIRDENEDGIDDLIYESNVTTFRNVKPCLVDYLRRNPSARLKIVAIGSASDLYNIPYWQSFTRAKYELREEFREMYGDSETFGRVSALFINVSTVAGKQLSAERPFISKEFCLSPKEVVEQSLPYVLDEKPGCLEITVIKPNPNFSTDWRVSNENIRRRWYQDMYGRSAEEKLKGGLE